MQYLLGMTKDINARDSKGLTPLHLAVESVSMMQTEQSGTRIIRRMLLKGADATIKDNKGRDVIEYMKDKVTDQYFVQNMT